MAIESSDWAGEFLDLVRTPELPDLGPRRREVRTGASELERAVREFCAARELEGETMDCLRSAALLWHDHLDLSHSVSQGILSADGSFLHGIMHRREPDYGNAAYWFRRVGEHRAYDLLAAAVVRCLAGREALGLLESLVVRGKWNAFAMIDACAAAVGRPDSSTVALLQEVQRLEFEALVRALLDASTNRDPRRGRGVP